jgi:3-deoxy-7-phosphoheptulonate synthase
MTATAPSEHPLDLTPAMTGLAEDDVLPADAPAAERATWRQRPAAQQPEWPDPDRLGAVTAQLAQLPPLVFAGECDQLTDRLAAVTRGEAFVLQGGDCAETFAGSTAAAVRAKLQTPVVLTYGASVPVVKIGRMAGQFAKPRSKPTEVRNGTELPAYRGDAVNGFDFTAEARTPDPDRLLRAYHSSAVTLNLCRAFTTGGYAGLHQVHAWNQDFVADSPAGQRYERLAGEIDRALSFMRACGAEPQELRTVELYSSH